MRIGIPKEIKDNENRVAVLPAGAGALAARGHDVCIERGAGLGAGFADDEYRRAGAEIGSADDAWSADLVVKVKEPLETEYRQLGTQIVFTYLHLAGVAEALTDALLAAGTTGIAYETVEDANGRLPLLAPMSAVAGSMAPIVGSYYLAKFAGGRGVLVSSLLGEQYGHVVVLGDGVVGRHAAQVAAAMGGRVAIFGRRPERAAELERLGENVRFVLSTPEALTDELASTDLFIGAVLIEGARAPRLVSAGMVAGMPDGAVIVDVSIDQGGCVATSRPTSHSDPVYVEHGVTHYCVTNMPGAYPRTSALALTSATLPYVCRIADGGIDAVLEDPRFSRGVNTYRGHVTCRPVADSLGRLDDYADLDIVASSGKIMKSYQPPMGEGAPTDSRLAAALERFEAAHQEDPRSVTVDGVEVPWSVHYHRRLAYWVARFDLRCTVALRLAAACQHIRRWEVPRAEYAEGRLGYRRWRADLAKKHAEIARAVLTEVGYDVATIALVEALLRKVGLGREADVQLFEDAICMVFFETDLADLARKHNDAKMVDILKKTWAKMSERGRHAARELAADLPAREQRLVEAATTDA